MRDGAKPRRGRPHKPDAERLGEQIALRLDKNLVQRIDVYIQRLREQQPGLIVSRSAVIRILLDRALVGEKILAEDFA